MARNGGEFGHECSGACIGRLHGFFAVVEDSDGGNEIRHLSHSHAEESSLSNLAERKQACDVITCYNESSLGTS